jgi:hypothetical protein
MKTGSKNSVLFTFLSITLFYLFIRWLIFSGFNGTDDLHYAMLASRMLDRHYSPFVPNDIFAGRIFLICYQALIYKIGGINIISTQAGTLLVTIFSCYLVVFRLLKYNQPMPVLLASSLFYFNPVLTYSTVGIMPDSNIMFIGIIIVMILKYIISEKKAVHNRMYSVLTGTIIGLSLLLKETAIIFVPFSCLLLLIYRPGKYVSLICFLLAGFSAIVLTEGMYYYHFTGNAFFKISQIEKSDFKYSSGYVIEKIVLLKRLTYLPWQTFLVEGFYPVLLATAICIIQWINRGSKFIKSNFYIVVFLLLLSLGLYFPFSFHQYFPLRAEGRYVLFLLPWAVMISSEYICSYISDIRDKYILFWVSLSMIAGCMLSTGNKWQWMIFLLITVFFLFVNRFKKHLPFVMAVLCTIFWLSLLEPVYLRKPRWFTEMRQMSKDLPEGCFYFPDQDNMMHWKLLHRFDNQKNTFFNLARDPDPFTKYYIQKMSGNPFKPGWFIVNSAYTVRSEKFFYTMDSLKNTRAFNKIKQSPHLEAYFIENQEKLNLIQTIVSTD